MELLERAPFVAQLDGYLHEAAAGQGRLVFLGGEAGVGKTVLIRHFCRSAESRARVLLGACDSLTTPRPLGPLLDMAAGIGGELERLLDGGGRRDDIFRRFLAELSAARPTLAVFEDVHWADEATLDLLRYLGRRLDPVRALLVATYRDDEIGPKHPLRVVMGDLATAPSSRRLALPRLSETAVGALAQASGSELDPRELHQSTGGNPFFVTEVLAAGSRGVPPTVRDAVLARAARLPDDARTAFEACALIGFRTEPWLLADVTDLSADAAEACVAQGVLLDRGGDLVFRHELAREAVLESLSPQRKLALHRGVLDALKRQGSGDPSRLAHHAEEAGDAPAVLEHAPAAARLASGLSAHREAADQYARALRFAGALPPAERARLMQAYALQCSIVDRQAETVRAYQGALAIWRETGDRLEEGGVLLWLSIALLMSGRNAEADEASQNAIALLETQPPSPHLARAYWTQAQLRMLNRDSAEAISWAHKAIELAQRLQDKAVEIASYNTLGAVMLVTGDDRGRALLERTIEQAREAGLEEDVARAYLNLGSALGEFYRFRQADGYLAQGIAYCIERDLDARRQYMLAWQALSHLFQGRWSEAADVAASVIRLPQVSAISRIMALAALGRVRTRRGDPEAWPALDAALELATQTSTVQRLAPVHGARAEAAYMAGDLSKTRTEARAAYDLAQHYQHPWFLGELAYWRWKAGDLDEPPPRAARPFALQMTGDWREAAAEWQRLDCPFEAARALAESGDEDALKRAHAEFERLGARTAAAGVARRMDALGLRGLPRGPRPSTRANPAQLTRRQLEVLRLMAEGLSNAGIASRLYRSPKTIDHHVSAIYSKLEVGSRTEALREAGRHGLLDPHPQQPNPK